LSIATNHYDIIFSGWGASSCILIKELQKKKLLANKRVLVIDPSDKLENDKTFCFWANKNEGIYEDYRSIISNHWSKIQINNFPTESIAPLFYFHINSVDLYNQARAIFEKFDITHLKANVTKIKDGKVVHVNTSLGIFSCSLLFDSRSLDYEKVIKSPHFIYQSFFGLKIKLKAGTFEDAVYKMMDFRVSQNVATQFVYVLPYDSASALVELTRFGKQIIDKTTAKEELEEYIVSNFGAYEVVDQEYGVIPMASINMDEQLSKNIIQIGTRAGNVKPSTGYAFKNMYNHAVDICENGIVAKKFKLKKRFQFYDQLLLIILIKWPLLGRPIFERLFATQHPNFILKFLDEKTSVKEDVQLFSKLQIGTFLMALWHWVVGRCAAVISSLILLMAAFAFSLDPVANELSSVHLTVLVVGLLAVGIPHGALDHLTGVITKNKKVSLRFIFIYLLLMVPIFGLWYFYPFIGLLLFVLYSAWHFGQTDMNHWGLKSYWMSIFWGITLLLYMFFSHDQEFIFILENLGITTSIDLHVPKLISEFLFICCALLAIIKKKVDWLLILAFLFVGSSLSLVLTFGLYFIYHHSRIGWVDLKSALKISNATMFVKALPFNLGALVIYLLFFLKGDFTVEQNISYFFIFLSCISFPHVLSMSGFYLKKTFGK